MSDAMKKLGFGCMRLPQLDPNDPASIDLDETKRMVDAFLARGFTYFDTAWLYHGFQSEVAVREALVKRHPREDFLLADKMPIGYIKTRAEQAEIFDRQLEKCGVDYFDYYLVHNLCATTYHNALALDTFAFLKEKQAQGYIRRLGFSFHDGPELLEHILTEHPDMEFVQLQLNYLDWDSGGIQSRLCHEVARRHKKPVLVMEPLKGGTLARMPQAVEEGFRTLRPQDSIPAWALRFAASQEGVEVVLSGMSNLEQLLDNTAAMADFRPLDREEEALVRQAAQTLAAGEGVPCTACRYCTEGCPKNIPIPQYFALYNNRLQQTQEVPFYAQSVYYENYAKHYGRASQCVGCGQCEVHCPQHIPIIETLGKVAALFEG